MIVECTRCEYSRELEALGRESTFVARSLFLFGPREWAERLRTSGVGASKLSHEIDHAVTQTWSSSHTHLFKPQHDLERDPMKMAGLLQVRKFFVCLGVYPDGVGGKTGQSDRPPHAGSRSAALPCRGWRTIRLDRSVFNERSIVDSTSRESEPAFTM